MSNNTPKRTNAENHQIVGGCFIATWQIAVIGPMYLVLMYQILNALGDSIPLWVWVLYWAYVPASLLGAIIRQGFALLGEATR